MTEPAPRPILLRPTLLRRTRTRLGRLRRRLLLHRRALAALVAAVAVLVGLQAAAPPAPPTTRVWTAARDLPSGSVLAAGDLAEVDYPPSVVPDAAVRDPRTVVGRPLAAPLTRGEPLTTGRVVAAGLLAGYPGTAAVPLRVTDAATVALLRVGDRVSFVAADPEGRGGPVTLVDDVPVVAVPPADRDGVGVGAPGRLVVVAVPRERAAEVAGRAATAVLIPVWNR